MSKVLRKIFMATIGVLSAFIPLATAMPVFADDCYDGAIIDVCDDGSGSSITHVLCLVVNILSIVIGVVAVIGIVVVGIQYMTAGGNEEQTRKAKRRLFEIIIGIAAYILMYALLTWLLPGFSPTCI